MAASTWARVCAEIRCSRRREEAEALKPGRQGRARHSVRAVSWQAMSPRRARSDAPHPLRAVLWVPQPSTTSAVSSSRATVSAEIDAVRQYGASVSQYATAVSRYGASVRRYATAVSRYGASVRRYATAVSRYGATVRPSATAVRPYAATLLQSGVTVRRYGGAKRANSSKMGGFRRRNVSTVEETHRLLGFGPYSLLLSRWESL